MNRQERLDATEKLLRNRGYDAGIAERLARNSIEKGDPLLESLCFYALAEHVLATIHSTSWIAHRGSDPRSDGHEVVKRLLESGASAEDLAVFARMMQREYLSNLGCILDGAGIVGTPKLPYEDFRVFSVNENGEPGVALGELHESLGWQDLETEMRLSREANEAFYRQAGLGEQ